MEIRKRSRFHTLAFVSLISVFSLLTAAAQDSTPPPELPDSPGTVSAAASEKQAASNAKGSDTNASQKPVGTAAADKPETTGVAASKPAGAAIAPARQRHVRSLLLKVGAIVGAGVAVGTVAALSSASPSRPPGSH